MPTPSTAGPSGIKLKLSLGSLSSAQAGPSTPTPTQSKGGKKGKTTDASASGSTSKAKSTSKKGKEKAETGTGREDDAAVAKAQPAVKLRLGTAKGSGSDNAKGALTTSELGDTPQSTKKSKKESKKKRAAPVLDTAADDAPTTPTIELDEPPIPGPSTPAPAFEPEPPSTPVNPSPDSAHHQDLGADTPMSPSAAETPTSTSSVDRLGQRISRNGKVMGRPRGSRTKPSPRTPIVPTKAKRAKLGKHVFRKPSAIPPRLLSSTPSTPRVPIPGLPLPLETPPAFSAPFHGSEYEDSPVKLEQYDYTVDPLSLPLSPQAGEVSTPRDVDMDTGQAAGTETSVPATPEVVEPVTRTFKHKKPLKELMQRIMVQLWRKDEYGLFGEPVDLESFPDYLEIIGGEERMMDLGRMQGRVDSGEYTDFDQFLADLRMLVTAAKTFNPEGTIPHIQAEKLLVLGEKQVDKLRPMVASPDPTNDPDRRQSESATPWSGREGTMPLGYDSVEDLPAQYYIPEEMLQFPPNSIYALAVGWNLTGGRRVYSKRQIRGKEKFNGKWRHWALDGTRDFAEMESPEEMLAPTRTTFGSRVVTDWTGLQRTGPWWEFELGGPNGVPPIAFTPYPRRAAHPHRRLDAFEWGNYPDLESQLAESKEDVPELSETEILSEMLRPPKPPPKPPQGPPSTFVNIYDDTSRPSTDWLRDMVYGDKLGEAYTRSVTSFLDGAMASAASSKQSTPAVKEEADASGDSVPLDRYVIDNWHNGVLQTEARRTVTSVLENFNAITSTTAKIESRTDHPPKTTRQRALLRMAKRAYERQAMKYLLRPANQLDIAQLLEIESDFAYNGQGSKYTVGKALTWVNRGMLKLISEQQREVEGNGYGDVDMDGVRENGIADDATNKRKRIKSETSGTTHSKRAKMDSSNFESAGSSPLSEAPESPKPVPPPPSPQQPQNSTVKVNGAGDGDGDGPEAPPGLEWRGKDDGLDGLERDEALKKIRLELVSLCKYYPLSALKKMSPEEAARLLPQSVRALMSRPSGQPQQPQQPQQQQQPVQAQQPQWQQGQAATTTGVKRV